MKNSVGASTTAATAAATRSRAASEAGHAEAEHQRDPREDPERVPVADGDEEPVVAAVEAAEMRRGEPRGERVDADARRRRPRARRASGRVSPPQDHQRPRHRHEVHERALPRVDRLGLGARPGGREEREHAERGRRGSPDEVEQPPARSEQDGRDHHHPCERDPGPAERRREEPAVRRADARDRDQRQNERRSRVPRPRPGAGCRPGVDERTGAHSDALTRCSRPAAGWPLRYRAPREAFEQPVKRDLDGVRPHPEELGDLLGREVGAEPERDELGVPLAEQRDRTPEVEPRGRFAGRSPGAATPLPGSHPEHGLAGEVLGDAAGRDPDQPGGRLASRSSNVWR